MLSMSRGKMGNFAFVLAGNLAEGLNTFEIKVRTFSQKLFDPTSKLPGGRIYKVSREESASEASLPGDEPPIPNIRADFPPFGPKSVRLSAKLPATKQNLPDQTSFF
jgi:hypothetical protein